MKANINVTFKKFIKLIGAKVTETSIDDALYVHKDYPSMLSYSDALDDWNIEHAAIKVTPEQLIELPTPFISYSRMRGGTFNVVKEVNESNIKKFDTENGWVSQKLEEFQKEWAGVALLAEPTEASGEKDYDEARKKEILKSLRIPLILGTAIVALLVVSFWKYEMALDLPYYLLFISKVFGVIVGTFLIIKSIDANNDLVNGLCNVGTKFSCQSILESDAAKVTSWLSLSDVGFVYAFGSFILFLSAGNAIYIEELYAYTILTAGIGSIFSIYSIYYQGFIAKMWCPLCLAVMFLFWLDFTIAFAAFNWVEIIQLLSPMFILEFIFSFSVVTAALLLIKPFAASGKKGEASELELRKLKNNPTILNAMLSDQKPMPYVNKGMGVLTLGKENTENTLTIVTNPMCSHCAKMHLRVEKFLESKPNFKVELIFMVSPLHENIGNKIVSKILSIPRDYREIALHEWFSQNNKNYDNWEKEYALYPVKEVAQQWISDHRAWINEAEVKATPTVFFNGKLLPMYLQIEDLSFSKKPIARETN